MRKRARIQHLILHNKQRSHRWKHGTVFLLLVLFALSLFGCNTASVSAPALLEPVQVKMDTEIVVKDTINDVQIFDASVVPYTEGVYFENECNIGEILVGVGDRVIEGQTILTVDKVTLTEEYNKLKEEISYTEQNNAYSKEQAECDLAITNLELESLMTTGTSQDIALKKLNIIGMEEQLNYTIELQQMELDKKKEKLSQLEQQLNYKDMTAPFDGTIVYISNLHEGDRIQPYEPIIYLADDTKLTIQCEYISERKLEESQNIYVMLDGKEYAVINVPYSEEEYQYLVYNKLTLKSNFILEDQSVELKSGTYACIAMVKNYYEDVLVVPKKAIYRDSSIRYVYLIVDGERVRQEVEIGASTVLSTAITKGLKEGDEVYVQQ